MRATVDGLEDVAARWTQTSTAAGTAFLCSRKETTGKALQKSLNQELIAGVLRTTLGKPHLKIG